jgi:hypothetical protein
VGTPESDPQIPDTPNLHSTDRRRRPPRSPIDVRPSDSSSGSAGPTSYAGTRALKSRGPGVQALSAPGGMRVRVDRMPRFLDATGEVDRTNERGSDAREVPSVSEAQILGRTLTPSLDLFLLGIGSNRPHHQQAFPSRRRGTNEQEGSPQLEESKFPLLFSSALQY